MTVVLQMLAAFLGSLGFGMLFNVREKKLIYAAVGGMLTWGVYWFPFQSGGNEAFCFFIASMVATLYAEILARIFKSPATTFLIPAIITLVPGGWLYYTMNAMVESDWSKAAECATQTLLLAMVIAGGIMVVTSVQKIFYGRRKGEKNGKAAV